MPRFLVHMPITSDDWAACDPQLVLTIDAPSDAMAQQYAGELFPDLEFDIVELECAECGQSTIHCICKEAA